METADNAFEFAFNWEGISSFNGTASAFRVVTQDGINILFVIEAVLDFQVAVAHVFVDVRIVVVISFLVEARIQTLGMTVSLPHSMPAMA